MSKLNRGKHYEDVVQNNYCSAKFNFVKIHQNSFNIFFYGYEYTSFFSIRFVCKSIV